MEIIGYYKRERDGNEYILYKTESGNKLTIGVCEWDATDDKMAELKKVKKINTEKIRKELKKFYPFHPLLDVL